MAHGKTVLNQEEIQRAVKRMAHEILERHKTTDRLALVGIRTGGAQLAKLFQEKLQEYKNISVMLHTDTVSFMGKNTVSGIAYHDVKSGEKNEIFIDNVFIIVGTIPNSQFLKGFCKLNQWGEIVIDPKTNATSHVGVFAAGDVTDISEKDAIIAAGEGAKTALQCYKWLKT